MFRRVGSSLYMQHTITLKEALLGFEHTASHLDSKPIQLKREGITPDGFVQKLVNKGMPKDIYSEDGDLFVEYRVLFPSNIPAEKLDLIIKAL